VESSPQPQYRFGPFHFDPSSGVLSKSGSPIRLQDQSARILTTLLERPGELVTRQTLQNLLWPDGVNVDFESGINSSMRRLRQTLLDDAERPRYIETVPRRGYRFLAAVEVVQPEPPPSAPPAPRRRSFLYTSLALAASGAAAVTWTLLRKSSKPLSVRSSILLPPPQSTARSVGKVVAISPDARQLAYISNTANQPQAHLHDLLSGNSQPLPELKEPISLQFLNSAQSLVFANSAGLFRRDGSTLRQLFSWPFHPSVVSIRATPSGDLLFPVPRALPDQAQSGLASTCAVWLKSAPQPRLIDIPYGGKGLETLIPQDLLDQRYLLYSSIIGPQARSLRCLDLTTGESRELLTPAMGGRFLPGGRILYFWAGSLHIAEFDRNQMQLQGQPRVVLSGVAFAGWIGPDADLSDDGTLVFVPENTLPDWKPVWIALDGKATPLQVPPGPYQVADISSDSRFLLLVRRLNNGLATLFRYEIQTGATVELVTDAEPYACFSPDNNRIAFSRQSPGDWLSSLHVLNINSRQIEWKLPFSGLARFPVQWHPNSNRILFVEGFHPKTNIDVYSVNFGDEKSLRLVVGGQHSQSHPRLSPNLRWLAFANRTGRGEITIQDLENPSSPVLTVPGQGVAPFWSADSSTIYYRAGREVRQVQIANGKLTPSSLLFEGDFVEPNHWHPLFVFDPIHKRFLFSKQPQIEVPNRIDVITNWVSTLG
jgi:DNA-binding winged helix-turn-helix (wHTH) protein